MTALPGTWDLKLKTPIGTLHVRYQFVQTQDGLEGSAASARETVPLDHIATTALAAGGEHVTWRQQVTKPMRLNLEFDVVVEEDTMTGHSRAGRLPRTTVTGRRVESGGATEVNPA